MKIKVKNKKSKTTRNYKVKENLIKSLVAHGFRQDYMEEGYPVYHKSFDRKECCVTLYTNYFNVYKRCWPSSEGWEIYDRPYLYKNIENACSLY